MTTTIIAVSGLDGYIHLALAHGTELVLTQAEFTRGLTRGKAKRRAQLQAARETHAQALREAGLLAWIDTDAPDRA